MKRMKKLLSLFLCVILIGCLFNINNVQAATVSLNKKSTSVYIGKTTQLKVNNYTGKIKWTSSNTSIATVSSTGKVKGKKAGTVTISARAGKKTLKCKVSVRSVIRVSPKKIYLDGTDDATITVTLKKNCDVSYSVSNSGIISCSWDDDWYKGGKETYLYITGERTGTTYITITNKYNNEKSRIKVVVDTNGADHEIDDNIVGDDQLTMAAIGIQGAYDAAKFPSTLHIRNISYENSLINGYGDNISRLVVHAYAKNSFGGYGDIYTVVIRSKSDTHYPNAFEYEGYYYKISSFKSDPGMNGVTVNNRDAVKKWKYLYEKNFEIPYD